MLDLFPSSPVRIQRVQTDDALRATDALKLLCDRLASHEHHYPTIKRWIAQKVVPDLKTGGRIGYVGFCDNKPVLAAVLKRADRTKFCHLSIDEGFQGNKLGYLMFSLMAAEVRNSAKEIHFTLPEGLWEREQGFFRTFGFESAALAPSQYRLFEQELRCSAPFSRVWNCVRSHLPTLLTSTSIAGFEVNDGVVLSLYERQATAVIQGRQTVTVRTRFADRWVGRNASVYASDGSGSLLGTVTISGVVKGSPEDIWERFEDCIGYTRDEFTNYTGDREYVYAVELTNPKPYQAPVPLSQLAHLMGEEIHPPQSHSTYSTSDSWGRALSLAAILHGKCQAVDHSASRSPIILARERKEQITST